MLAGPQAVVVAQKAHEREWMRQKNVARPQKFFGNAKIALVAAMHNELHISRVVNHIHGCFHFVVSTLRIGDKGEANGVASLANALYVGNIFGVEVVWPVDVGTIGNVLKIRTTSYPYTNPEP